MFSQSTTYGLSQNRIFRNQVRKKYSRQWEMKGDLQRWLRRDQEEEADSLPTEDEGENQGEGRLATFREQQMRWRHGRFRW